MAAALSIRLVPDTAKTLAFGAIAAGYMGVGAAFDHPVRILMIQNLTDAQLMFSFDGINDHVPLPREGYLLLDVTANKATEGGFYIAEGTRVYVKQIEVPTVGSVYVTTFYGANT